MPEHFYALILAGGGGTRLWPMSRSETPKQFLPLVENQSMFKVSVERLSPLFAPEQIYIAAGKHYIERLREDTPQIPAQNFIAEPYGRNNAPAVALAVAAIQQRDPQATVAILTSDHHIGKKDVFRSVLSAAHEIAQDDYIVTLGISPSFPSTGFGYIRQGVEIRKINGFSIYHSRGFVEKPDVVAATNYVASGEYSWNSGMFIVKAEQLMAEFKRQQPALHTLITEVMTTLDTPDYENALVAAWDKMPAISIDYAVMENAHSMAVIPVDMQWSDMGSWVAMFDILPKDKFGNCSKGEPDDWVKLDTRRSLVYSERLAVTIGVEDLIVVDTEDVLFICHRDRAQDVRDVVNYLKKQKRDAYL